jgi:hypothetical protein
MDPDQEWTRRNGAALRRTLADPAIRAELLALLGADDSERRRARRLEAARADLEARGLLDPAECR